MGIKFLGVKDAKEGSGCGAEDEKEYDGDKYPDTPAPTSPAASSPSCPRPEKKLLWLSSFTNLSAKYF